MSVSCLTAGNRVRMTQELLEEVQPVGDSKSDLESVDTSAKAAGDGTALNLGERGGGGSGQLLAHAVDAVGLEPPESKGLDLLFDIDPRDPAVILAFLIGCVCLAATAWCGRRRRRRRPNSGGGIDRRPPASEDYVREGRPKPPVGPSGNTRGNRRVADTPGTVSRSTSRASPGKVVILTPQQVSLCDVLYDVYGGKVPSRGIENKAVEETGLSVGVGIVGAVSSVQQCDGGSTLVLAR